MKAQICRLCGNPHWSNEPHQFGPTPKATKAESVIKAKVEAVTVPASALPAPKPKPVTGFDKATYQREYMRKWAAAKRAKAKA